MNGEPFDLDTHIRRRAALLATWAAWDEQPGNVTRAHARVDAAIDYAGAAHVALTKFLVAARRAGATYEQALTAWENDW